ncbi:cupin domain protein [Fusobacterium equinum]|uniref:Cupin domain protein n=1 Tax=Fusobacterium equinum TaxID=134605 RepID=A0A133N9W1_9FUSO|nr:cupin domain-containing protein [Fusobacterium equinum]KXA13079.1 cupin domain protein [Fusobacterium equinum]
MIEIKKIPRGSSFFLKEEIKVRNFQVSSKILVQSSHARMALVSMGKGEEISAETMPYSRCFQLLKGKVFLQLNQEKLDMEIDHFLLLGENSFYSIHAEEDSIFLEIEYDRGGNFMSEVQTIKHITRGTTFALKEEISYEAGQIISKNLVTNNAMVMTLMSFDQGESLAAHKAPGDALVSLLDGEAKFWIDGKENVVKAGESILLPGNISHAVEAIKAFKMLLIIVK